MIHSARVLQTFVLLVLVGIGAVAADDDLKKVDFPDHAVTFPVPKGWKALKHETAADHAWCVLQQVSKERNKATIVLYAGRKYITESPETGNLAAGKPHTASAWAQNKALAWSEGAMDGAPARGPEGVELTANTFGTTIYLVTKSQVGGVQLFGLCAEKRAAGPLTVGCACTAKSARHTQQVLEAILGKLVVR